MARRRCRKCGGSVDDARAVRAKLVEGLARIEEHCSASDKGVYYALGALQATAEIAADALDLLCFGCGDDARRAEKRAAEQAVAR